jgi:predicted TIM-barrel fold metal-dependent hydrolase
MSPAAYMYRNIYWVFVVDSMEVKLRHEVGMNNLLWSSDHPHSFSHWPKTQKYLDGLMQGVPDDKRQQLLAGNAMRLYKIGSEQPAMAGSR